MSSERYTPEMLAWAESQPRCWGCGQHHNLQTHHFVRGSSRRKNDLKTVARLCSQCHNDEHWGKSLGLVRLLALKLVHDVENYDREYVNKLRGRAPDAVSEQEVAVEVAKLFRGGKP